MDFSLHAALMEIVKENVQAGGQVQGLQIERFTFRQLRVPLPAVEGTRANLNVLPAFAMPGSLEPVHQFGEFRGTRKRLTVIGKRKGHEAAAADPSMNAAENDTVGKFT